MQVSDFSNARTHTLIIYIFSPSVRVYFNVIYIGDLICSIKLTNKNDEWIGVMTIWLMGINKTQNTTVEMVQHSIRRQK